MKTDFTQTLKQHSALLARVASGYEANDALRQELLQEIAIAVWQGLKRFEGKSSLKTYILKIAHNRAVSHIAANARVPALEPLEDHIVPASVASSSPEQQTVQDSSLNALLSIVRQLPLPGRQVLTLSLEGLSYEEIADISGLTRNHVGVILKRTKSEVVRRMENA
ncbi:RNA polymerase sigma factor [Aestuariibacter sp. A3R04]|uniref:RNA polymerase sigma factor n=1 Tax=Aestuariibacter sp. A3R04 TaxID=2841571 RepID=UPI001C090641|nr:sigma-70 family RNA polymerase sigma factor [Aestuariibacter sp. A3R04]MBU3020286.1 sigma-70 family RNA polymerase sigma factor [Aestuariibacter sp. A3R04]